MDVVYRLGRATVNDVLHGLDDPPSYSAVRAMLGKLSTKGYLTFEQDGPRYVYVPGVPTENARRTAMQHLVETFFDGSAEQAMLALAQLSDTSVHPERLEALAARIKQAREEGK